MGIDAYCLGFKEGPKGTETPYDQLSRRNSYHSDYSLSSHQSNHNEFPMDIIWGNDESLTADHDSGSSNSSSGSSSSANSVISATNHISGSKNNKKKKKKKKKSHH
jgi:hypothetical protein